MANSKQKQRSVYWLLVIMGIVLVIATILVWKPWASNTISNFESCKSAGGAILESYPEQCMMNGKSFTNTAQIPKSSDGNAYIGMAEQTAIDQAKSASKIARVVERDGEALPMTMDYVPGRLNLYVKDGKVYKVEVEGSEGQPK